MFDNVLVGADRGILLMLRFCGFKFRWIFPFLALRCISVHVMALYCIVVLCCAILY